MSFTENIKRIKERNTDVTLIYPPNTIINANRTLLAAQSIYFREKFYGIEPNNDPEIQLSNCGNISGHLFVMLTDYVYDGQLKIEDLSEKEVMDLYHLINFYQFESLEQYMVIYYTEILSHENCWSILGAAVRENDKKLGNKCAQFISQNITDIATNPSFLDLNAASVVFLLRRNTFYLKEIDIFNAARKWYEKNQENYEELRDSIRFTRATNEERQMMSEWENSEETEEQQIMIESERNQQNRHTNNCRYLIKNGMIILYDDYKFDTIVTDDGSSVRDMIRLGKPIQHIAMLNNTYLINHISMDTGKSDFNYRIEVSIDKHIWEPIVDYLEFKCRGEQNIYFKSRPVNYVKIIGRDIVRTTPAIPENSSSNLWDKINCQMSFELNPIPMTSDDNENRRFLIPNYNIGPFCYGRGANGNMTLDKMAKIDNKRKRPFKGYMDREDKRFGEYRIDLPQPCQLSRIEFNICDRTNDERTYHYRVESFLDDNKWTVLAVKDDAEYKGIQRINFNPTAMISVRIVPTNLFNNNSNERRFPIADFKIFNDLI